MISGSSPKLGCQFDLAIAHPCGDELDNQGACSSGEGWAFPSWVLRGISSCARDVVHAGGSKAL